MNLTEEVDILKDVKPQLHRKEGFVFAAFRTPQRAATYYHYQVPTELRDYIEKQVMECFGDVDITISDIKIEIKDK